jgi:stage II sporulation protein D
MRAHRARLLGCLGLLVVAALGTGAGGVPARAAPPAGWEVGRVRFEPLAGEGTGEDAGAGATVVIDGMGEYRGAMEVARTSQGLAVVNDVGLDDYLRGLGEMPSSWPAEALRAQAIAGRTYALWEAFSGVATAYRAAGAHICATQSCQVYVGVAKERGPHGDRWSAAVDSTSGQVLLYEGRLVMAKYSSSNGGRSIAGSRPYLRAVDDPDDATSPLHRWRSVHPLETVRRVFAVADPLVAVTDTGDAIALVSQGSDGNRTQLRLPKGDFRTRLNSAAPAPAGLPRAVPSNRFTVSTAGDAVVVDGRGYGHGIGMSQYGALGKALRGMRAPDILAAYYAGIRPTQLAPQQLPPSIRVALALDRQAVQVRSTGPFRVVDEAGTPLAVLAGGTWDVRPGAGGTVRVVPPEGFDSPVGVEAVAVEAAPASPPVVRFRVSVPARVQVTVSGPGVPPVASEPRVVAAGEVEQVLPAVVPPGEYEVLVHADAGGGRVASAPTTFRVGAGGEIEAAPGSTAVPGPGAGAAAGGPAGVGGRLAAAGTGEDPPIGAVGAALVLVLAVAAALGGHALLERRRAAFPRDEP